MNTPSPNHPAYLFEDYDLDWLMTRWEKYSFNALLSWIQPQVALEIGTFRGGSLQVIARHSSRVVSVDMIDEPKRLLSERFDNVDFRVGDSLKVVPEVIRELGEASDDLQFVLIDGDHSTDGVRNDIENVLAYAPSSPMYIIMHDSFHPPCREGMLAADWASSPYVEYVEIDFVPGVYYREGNDEIRPGSMYGGFAMARLTPEKRTGPLQIGQVHRGLYDATRRDSDELMGLANPDPAQRPNKSLVAQIRQTIGVRTRVKRLLGME